MQPIEVCSLMKAMSLVRRISFFSCLFVLSFFLYIGFKGIEYDLTDTGITAMMILPLLLLFTSARWWESLSGKKYIRFSMKNEKHYGEAKKPGHKAVKQEVYASETIQV